MKSSKTQNLEFSWNFRNLDSFYRSNDIFPLVWKRHFFLLYASKGSAYADMPFTYPFCVTWHIRPPHTFSNCLAAARSSFHDLHPAHFLSASTAFCHVVVGLLLFLFPSGVHISGALQLLSYRFLGICLVNIHRLHQILLLNLSICPLQYFLFPGLSLPLAT